MTVWLVKVSGLYIAPGGGLVGHPEKANLFHVKAEAFALAKSLRRRRAWLGRIFVVRRKHLRAPQW